MTPNYTVLPLPFEWGTNILLLNSLTLENLVGEDVGFLLHGGKREGWVWGQGIEGHPQEL